jgi:hypothetical protein
MTWLNHVIIVMVAYSTAVENAVRWYMAGKNFAKKEDLAIGLIGSYAYTNDEI